MTCCSWRIFVFGLVCHHRGGCYIHTGWFPQMDPIEVGLSRATGVDRCDCIVFLRIAQFDSGWNFLFPIDRSLRGIDNGSISGIFPNRCNRMVLQSVTIVTEHQTNDGETAITLFPIMLASDRTMFIIRK